MYPELKEWVIGMICFNQSAVDMFGPKRNISMGPYLQPS